jgi:peptidoglycan/LPS O-acetylase OafA/YrhL
VAAKLLTALGVALVLAGIALTYLDVSYVNFGFVIAAGVVLSFLSAIAWGWHTLRNACWLAGTGCLAVAVGSFLLAVGNVHTFGPLLVAAVPACVLALIMLAIGAIRGRRPEPRDWEKLSRRVSDESMRVNAEFSAIERDPGD